MSAHVALLRGINVGGRNRLSMDALAGYFEAQGAQAVRTLIQSGNVVFQCDAPEVGAMVERVALAIGAANGFTPSVLVLSAGAFRAVMAANPFPTERGKALHVFFLAALPSAPDMARLDRLAAPSERFVLDGCTFFLLAPDGVGRSRLAPAVEACLGVAATARNWNTVSALGEMLGPP